MNEEQETTGKASVEQDTSKLYFTTNSSLQSKDEEQTDKGRTADDHGSMHTPKPEVHTTIGDGKMRNEGLVGEGNLPAENPFSGDPSTNEEDTD